MSVFVKEETKYIVARTRNGQETVMSVDNWSGATYWNNDVQRATFFETEEEAQEMSNLQEMMSQIMKASDEFKVLKRFEKTSKIEEEQEGTSVHIEEDTDE